MTGFGTGFSDASLSFSFLAIQARLAVETFTGAGYSEGTQATVNRTQMKNLLTLGKQ